ncbi:hypothetical protein [Streptomyces sp. NPDC046979]|uniref:hypothetical protein n=1 Tax=Streptomyces sp. NPDC046979 TaxID=3154604 RepID=UPI0033FC6BED
MNVALLRELLTDKDLNSTVRVVGAYLLVAPEPQNSISLSAELGLTGKTITRATKALSEKGLIRRRNGVWMPEVHR